LIIYRNGCAEGQFTNILKYEVPLIKHQLETQGSSAKLTLIMSNKLQNVRFLSDKIDPRAKPTEQNIKPGTVVDTSVVHPSFTEFFLNSHRAIQGTARTPKYTVLYDDNKMNADQLQSITYHLCFGHQIVYLPTSLPSPVYIANRYAERGRNMYRRFCEVSSTSEHENLTYQELTEVLSYETSTYYTTTRVNA
jgi:eukaryotic translation initiation factor 2C